MTTFSWMEIKYFIELVFFFLSKSTMYTKIKVIVTYSMHEVAIFW